MKPADRRHFLGGTDAPAVMGLTDWASQYEVWAEKAKGVRRPVSEAQKRMFARGKRLEPVIREMTIQKLVDEGHEVKLLGVNRRYSDPAYPFLACEIDFELEVDGEEVNTDAKSVSGFARKKWGEVGTDEIPIEYAAQFMHGLGIVPGRRKRTLVAALRSFDDVDLYWLHRDDDTIAGMRQQLVAFWQNHVLPKVPPDPTKFADLRGLYPKAQPIAIEATQVQVDQVARLRAIASEIQALEREKEDIRFEIARYMGKHALLKQGGRDLMTWDTETRKSFQEALFKKQKPDWAALYTTTTRGRVLRLASRR